MHQWITEIADDVTVGAAIVETADGETRAMPDWTLQRLPTHRLRADVKLDSEVTLKAGTEVVVLQWGDAGEKRPAAVVETADVTEAAVPAIERLDVPGNTRKHAVSGTVVLDLGSGAELHVGHGKGADALEPFWKRQGFRAKIENARLDSQRCGHCATQTQAGSRRTTARPCFVTSFADSAWQ